MGSSLKLFTFRGIDVKIHVTFPLILVWAAIQFGLLAGAGWTGALFGILVTLILFIIVTLHEFGHSIAAQYYGLPVEDITLLPIGGVARLRQIPENPIKELVIAVAGPAVNFGIAILLGLLLLLPNVSLGNPTAILTSLDQISLSSLFTFTFVYNLFLGIFNLIPAFPMDGGRILRALLATRLTYPRATQIATTVGRSFAWILGLWGFLGGGFFLLIIAFFVYIGAGQENAQVQMRHALRGLRVGQAFSPTSRSVAPTTTLEEIVSLTLSSLQATFPVCDEDRLLGLITYPQLLRALQNQSPQTAVSEVMRPNVPTLTHSTPLYDAQQKLAEAEVDALPVMENGRFVGLLTMSDINEVYRLMSIEPALLQKKPAQQDDNLPQPKMAS